MFAVFGMAATSSTVTTTSVVPPAAHSSMQQRRVVPKRRPQRRMIYGFTFSHKELVEWGQQHLGEINGTPVHPLLSLMATDDQAHRHVL